LRHVPPYVTDTSQHSTTGAQALNAHSSPMVATRGYLSASQLQLPGLLYISYVLAN
jgi:hypothetical protein